MKVHRNMVIKGVLLFPDDLEYNCRFALPSMGRFLLEVCSEAAERICRSEPLGWTRDEWEKK